jgi:hypothetical protein
LNLFYPKVQITPCQSCLSSWLDIPWTGFIRMSTPTCITFLLCFLCEIFIVISLWGITTLNHIYHIYISLHNTKWLYYIHLYTLILKYLFYTSTLHYGSVR